jgi:hypothetical protein
VAAAAVAAADHGKGGSMIKNTLKETFDRIGIVYEENKNADFEIELVLADDKWKAGKKKKTFSASILIDESAKKLLYWEMIKETKAGLSISFSKESAVQKGNVVARKQGNAEYALEGKVSETQVDFGKITKSVKEVAKQEGYKFKLVLSKKKASY